MSLSFGLSLSCLLASSMLPILTCYPEQSWYLDQNLTISLDMLCDEYRSPNPILFLVQHKPSNWKLNQVTHYLRSTDCPFVDLLLECESCIRQSLGLYNRHQRKLILVNYSELVFEELSYLVDRINWIYNDYCESSCRLLLFVDGPDFDSYSSQMMLANTLFSSNPDLRCTVVNHQAGLWEPVRADDIAYIRPILNGCVEYPGILHPDTDATIASLSKLPTQCDLGNRTLRVAVNEARPFCNLDRSVDGQVRFVGFSSEIELMTQLGKLFNFRLEPIHAKQIWGSKVNGTFEGSIGLVANKSADVALCIISWTEERTEVVDFTISHSNDQFGYVSQNPPARPPSLIMLHILSWNVWLLLLFSSLFSFGLLCLTVRLRVQLPAQKLLAIGEVLLQILLCQPASLAPSRLPSSSGWSFRIILVFWALAMLIFVQYLGAQLFALLQFNEYDNYVETREDLERIAAHDLRYVFTVDHIESLFTAHTDNTFLKTISDHFKRNNVHMVETLNEGLNIVSGNARSVFIGPKFQTSYVSFIEENKPVHLSYDTILLDLYYMALPRRSPLKRAFDIAIQRFWETGILNMWRDKSYRPRQSILLYSSNLMESVSVLRDDVSPLNLNTMSAIFLVLVLGQILSFLTFLLELGVFFVGVGQTISSHHHHRQSTRI